MKSVNGLIFLFTMVLILNSHSDSTASNRVEFTTVNPIYKHLPKQFSTDSSKIVSAYSLPVECNSNNELKARLKDFYTSRTQKFSIHLFYDFMFDDLSDILKKANDEVMASDDYLNLSYKTYRYEYNGYDGDVTIEYNVVYLTTYDEEQKVTEEVDNIIAAIIVQEMDDGQMVKVIHDWIVSNLEYDTSGINYSTYAALFEGKAVCQGYSLLAYKMFQKAGIQARIVTSEEMDHAWNMVKLCKTWYHIDATWDDPVPDRPGIVSNNFYMKSDDEFLNHYMRNHTWAAASYPQAPQSYQEEICHQHLTQTQVSQLYVTIFGRASEGRGNQFWMGTTDMNTAAASMLESTGALAYFGTSVDTNAAFIQHIYVNTLGKAAGEDPVGEAFWVAAIDTGMSRSDIVVSMIDAVMMPVNVGKSAQVRFSNKVTVSNYAADNIAEPNPDDNNYALTRYVSDVSDNATSVTTVKATIDADVSKTAAHAPGPLQR
jgi:hypothetical protein